MIVLGADTHKRSHTIAAVAAATGELLGEQTVRSAPRASRRCWSGRAAWAASGSGRSRTAGTSRARLERFLIERGERVLRVHDAADGRRRGAKRADAASPTASTRSRSPGRRCAKAWTRLPAAQLDGPELDLRLLVDHRERLVRQRVALNNTLQWHLHDLWPELQLPGQRAVSRQVGPAHRPPARARRADDARPDRPRRAAPHPRAHPDDQGARSRDRRPGRPDRAAAARRARVRPADRGQARRRDRRRPAASPPTPSSPAPPASPRSPSAPATPTATASTAAATARSTPTIHRIAVTRAALPPRDPGLHRPQTRRRQEHQRSHPLPQTPPHPPHLAPPPTARTQPGPDATPSIS